MRHPLAFVVMVLLALAPTTRAANPIVSGKFTADPAALVHDGRLYLYTGHDEATERDRHFVMRDWLCFSSDDMLNWKPEGSPLAVAEFEWARGDAWASQVIERDGKFYWYATVRHRTINGFSIGVAVADKPTGPFKDARGSALIRNDMTRGPQKNGREMDWDDLDPTVIIDDDGQAYLFWGNTQCYYAKLKSNMTELAGPIEKVDLPKFTEAPWIHKHNGRYYLSYAYDYPEQIGYATAEKITGPWTFRGVINDLVQNSPTNHQSIIEFKGKWYFIYHNAALPGGGEHRRSVCVEELFYNADGTIRPITQDPRGVERAAAARRTALFPLSQVRLLDGPFKEAEETDRKYLLAHDVDRLLAPYRAEAGLAKKAEPYGDWESSGLGGHSAGHYLSALAMMYASTGDAEIKRRLDYMVAELAECQKANGDGYVGGIPKSKALWRAVAAGEMKVTGFGLNDRWVPWYNLHKTYAGLRDAHLMAGSAQAKDVLVALSEWCLGLMSHLSDEQMQQMLRAEHGGMNEVLADVTAITGDDRYLAAARRFSDQSLLGPLAASRDELTGKHANTQIPKVVGFQRIAELSGASTQPATRYHQAASFFWETVTRRRSVAIGGNSVNEHFHPADNFKSMVEDRTGPETCNTYNMLRLTEALYEADPRPEYADYYERALLNHILSSQHPGEGGGFVYFTPMRPRHYRVYSQPGQNFWCCVGTGFENHAKYGKFIYAHEGDDTLFVNLFIASQLEWTQRGVTVRQETKFPDEPRTRIAIRTENPTAFTLKLRHPEWVARGGLAVTVNGQRQDVSSEPSSYVALRREWKDGDVVELELPMHLKADRLPDNSDFVAMEYGPVVLAAATGTEELVGLRAGPGRSDQIPNGPLMPIAEAPALVADDAASLAARFKPVDGEPLTFRADADLVRPTKYGQLKLVPFFRLHDARYVIYWPLFTPAKYEAELQRLVAAEKERLALEAVTVDRVVPGEQQSEVDHGFKGDQTSNGTFRDRSWRDARGWFSYELRVPKDERADLMVTYWGDDRDRRFEVLADDELLGDVHLDGERGPAFFDVRYPAPDAAKADGKLTITFRAKPGSIAGGAFGIRVIRDRARAATRPAAAE